MVKISKLLSLFLLFACNKHQESTFNVSIEDNFLKTLVDSEIKKVTSLDCDNEENGNIYEDEDGEVGNIVGEIKDGEATFFK